MFRIPTILVALTMLGAAGALAPAVNAGHGSPNCLFADISTFDELKIEGARPGVDGYTMAVGYSLDRLPMTPTRLAVGPSGACDVTNGLAAFLGERASPTSPEEALDLALFGAEAVYIDVFPGLKLAEDVGLPAEPTVVTPVEGGYVVEFTGWTERNGVLARFTVTLDGDASASFVTIAGAVGPFEGTDHGWLLYPGDTEQALLGAAAWDPAFTKVIFGTNSDGTKFRVTYFTQRYANGEPEADYHANMHLTGIMAAYEEGVTQWGFFSADPDRIMDLTLDGCDCIYGGYQANIHMFPRANDILPYLPGLAYRTEAELAQLIAGHELFHHFQYSIQQWRLGNWLIEGTARFSETVHVPDATFLPTTLVFWPNINGFNGFVNNANTRIGAHMYDWGIVWGYLHNHNGGMPFIKAVLEETLNVGGNIETDGPKAIDRALARMPGKHDDFGVAYRDFSAAMYTRDPADWTWGKSDGTQEHDWSTYLVPVRRQFANTLPANVPVVQWGIVYVDAAGGASGGITAVSADDVNVVAQLATRSASGTQVQPLTPFASASGVTDGVVAVMRADRAVDPVNPLVYAGALVTLVRT